MDNKKILLVEDDVFIQELYTRELKKAGFTVEATGDGDDAIKKIDANDYDLVMLDIMLPGKDGVTILEHLKKHTDPKKAATTALMLTNMGQEEIVTKTTALGAAGYLIKSEYDPFQVIDEVKKYIK